MTGRRVLVIEDDALIGMYLTEMLTVMGHDVCSVETTEADAVAAATRCKPDLMIVDARLSDGSGIAAVDRILRDGFVPHVFVSGAFLDIQTLRPGAVVLQKPYTGPDLTRAIQRALDVVA